MKQTSRRGTVATAGSGKRGRMEAMEMGPGRWVKIKKGETKEGRLVSREKP